MNTGDVLRDGWRVYVLLFRRSIVVAGVVYLAVAAIEDDFWACSAPRSSTPLAQSSA